MASLSAFFTPFMAASVNIALPSISEELSLNTFLYGWVATSYLLSTAMMLIPFGRLADIRGRKKIFLLGVWIFSISTALCAIAPTSETLILFRVVQGMGSAMMFSTMTALVVSVYPPQERGKAIGITTAVVYVALSAGPFIGGILTGAFGWRSLFILLLPMSVPILYIGHRVLKTDWAEAKGERFDKAGSAIYAVALTCVIIGFSLLPDMVGMLLTIGGAFGMVLFAWFESRIGSPVLDMHLFRENKSFAFSNLAALINYGATFAVGFLMSAYLQFVKGMHPWDAGIVMCSQPIVMAVFSPIAGKLSDRIEPRLLATAGMAITTVGLLLFTMLAAETLTWMIIANLVFLGLGFALFSSPNTNAVMSSVEKRHIGTASATVGTMRSVGQVISIGVANLCISLFIGNAHIDASVSADFLRGAQLAFSLFTVLCFLGIFASLARGNLRNNTSSGPS